MAGLGPALTLAAAGAACADAEPEAQIEALVPALEAYVESGMAAFDDPGLAIGIVAGDRLVYAKGFGVVARGGAPAGPDTVFQIGSTTKAFLGTSIAVAVDRGKLAWDDRVIDRHPDFQLMDPWVTREFRVFDLLAQRSGLPSYANDTLACSASTSPRCSARSVTCRRFRASARPSPTPTSPICWPSGSSPRRWGPRIGRRSSQPRPSRPWG